MFNLDRRDLVYSKQVLSFHKSINFLLIFRESSVVFIVPVIVFSKKLVVMTIEVKV